MNFSTIIKSFPSYSILQKFYKTDNTLGTISFIIFFGSYSTKNNHPLKLLKYKNNKGKW